MLLAVASMTATGMGGFAAQEEGSAEDQAQDMLVRHRTTTLVC